MRAVPKWPLVAAALCVSAATLTSWTGRTTGPDLRVEITQIRQEALLRSEVMDLLGWISDIYGPRLTGSTAMKSVAAWAQDTLRTWGLSQVREEQFEFGTEWTPGRFQARLVSPYSLTLTGVPHLWAGRTAGRIEADVMVAPDIGRLEDNSTESPEGKIVLAQHPRLVGLLEGPVVLRMGPELLAEAGRAVPLVAGVEPDRTAADLRAIQAWARRKGAVAVLDRGGASATVEGGQDSLSWTTQRTDGGTVFPAVDDRSADGALPAVTLASEHYNLLHRLVVRGAPVRVELEVDATRRDAPDIVGRNTVAEIPGGELKHEVVMLGAHLDSTHGATGATDNAAGVAACMEAVRIINGLSLRPKRTIRLALWDGEEHGLMGSRAYVKRHVADPRTRTRGASYGEIYAYFNVDNGAGRIRGVWAQGNLGAVSLLDDWLTDTADLDAVSVGRRSVGSSDHVAFEAVGIPGFQFMQDRLEYNSRSHHSNMDVLDRVQPADITQMVAVIASVIYRAANEPRPMPRKGFPLRLTPPSPRRWPN